MSPEVLNPDIKNPQFSPTRIQPYMTATRIVLSSRYKPYAEELLAVTGIDSLSNLFIVFLTRYGHHLQTSWNISQPGVGQTFVPTPVAHSVIPVSVVQSQIPYQPEQVIPEPKLEPIDPVIAHIAQHLERF